MYTAVILLKKAKRTTEYRHYSNKALDVLLLYFSVPSSAPTGVRVNRFDYTYDLQVEWDPLPDHLANGKILGYTIYYMEFNYFWSPH